MMFVDSPWPVTTRAPGPSSVERRQRTRTWPWASSPAGDRLDLVLDERRLPAEDRPDRVVDGREEGVDRPVAGRLGGPLLAVDGERHRAGGVAAVRRGDAPADERDRRRDLGRALLDEREQVRVGDLLLGVGQGDRLAVDLVERLALDLVAELLELALEARAGRTACRSSAGCRTARPTAGS